MAQRFKNVYPPQNSGMQLGAFGTQMLPRWPLQANRTQTIAMGDVAITLGRRSAAGETLLIANQLYVDAESSGTENLLLPPEAECDGVKLYITNTGGESIVVQTDAGGTIATIATANFGFFFCDGTTWFGLQMSEFTLLTDDVPLLIGTNGPSSLSWDTTDANANELLLQLPAGGGTDVPAWIIGQSIESVDFGLYNGLVDPLIMILGVGARTTAATIEFRKTRGTAGTPTVITSGDALGTIDAYGYSGAGGYVQSCAIEFLSEGTIATNRVPGRMLFRTGTDAGTTVLTTALEIGSDQIATFAAKITAELGIFDADLILDSTNGLTMQIGQIGLLEFDDSAISGFTAATDTAGQDAFIETQDAGGTPTAARAGGNLNIRTGEGAAAATTVAGGVSGTVTLQSGVGGNTTGTGNAGASGAAVLQSLAGGANSGAGANGVGGASGAVTVQSSNGGATNNTGTDNAGNSGAVLIGTGNGGAATGAGDSDGGSAGDINLTPGIGGASSNGQAGVPGDVAIGAGVLTQQVQTIAMGDVAVTLTRVPGTPVGTLLTANILYVDAQSGSTENLLLPPEADCTGIKLHIENTGGETINIQNDGAGAILTLETLNVAVLVCDGTTWTGFVAVP